VPTTTRFTTNGIAINADVYVPATATTAPGLIVIAYGTDGMLEPWGTQIRGYAEGLSSLGFISLIPDYFACTGTSAGQGALQEIPTQRDTWDQALADAVTYAEANLGIDAKRVGLLGFSLGGHLCLCQRAVAKVLVEFFAPELDGLGSTAGVTSHAQIHHGQADELVPFHPNVDDIGQALKNEGIAVDLFSYPGATHGFIGVDANNANARAESLRRTLSCFETYL
jgi:dienelactone hydrolase